MHYLRFLIFLRFLEVLITLPKIVTGLEENVSSLFLIVPDCDLSHEIPLLIGTNVLDRLYEKGVNREGPKFL